MQTFPDQRANDTRRTLVFETTIVNVPSAFVVTDEVRRVRYEDHPPGRPVDLFGRRETRRR